MDKKQISQETHASVFSNANRQLLGARVLLVLLFLALSLASLQPKASAEAADQTFGEQTISTTNRGPRTAVRSCPECESGLSACIASGGGSECYTVYNACIAGCL
jgi:hypothetical protein